VSHLPWHGLVLSGALGPTYRTARSLSWACNTLPAQFHLVLLLGLPCQNSTFCCGFQLSSLTWRCSSSGVCVPIHYTYTYIRTVEDGQCAPRDTYVAYRDGAQRKTLSPAAERERREKARRGEERRGEERRGEERRGEEGRGEHDECVRTHSVYVCPQRRLKGANEQLLPFIVCTSCPWVELSNNSRLLAASVLRRGTDRKNRDMLQMGIKPAAPPLPLAVVVVVPCA